MTAVIIDTEYTAWQGSLERNWSGINEHREIVQFAAIITDCISFEVMDSLSLLVKPSVNPELSNYFTNLTGITNISIENAAPFIEGMQEYSKFIGNRPVFAYGDEGEIIRENLLLSGIEDNNLLTNVNNLRPWFHSKGVNADEVPSGELHKEFGIELQGDSHNAMHDVLSIHASIRHLVNGGSDNPFVT